MTTTETTIRKSNPSGATPELIAGLAVIILMILGLAGVAPSFFIAIATIVFGAGLILHGSSSVSTIIGMLPQRSAGEAVADLAINGWSVVFLVGLAGVVLGILALLGIVTITLVAIAVIAFGGALLMSSRAAMQVKLVAISSTGDEPMLKRMLEERAADMAGTQTMSGLTAIVLGILALSGFSPTILLLAALLSLGCFSLLSSTFLGSALTHMFRA
jgi:hypothetical protein